MPIYEYKCSKCGEIFEAFQKISDEPLTRCKYCKGKVEKILSQTSFQLKGSGWYLTDYSRKSTPPSSTGDSGSKSAEKSDKSTEAASTPTSTSNAS